MSDRSYDFFMEINLRPYSDEWIAIVDSRVVSHGKNARLVFEEAKSKYPRRSPLMTRVPGKMAMIL